MKSFKIIVLLLLGGLAVAFSSCASIVTRSVYPVEFNSTPEGARMTVVNRDGRTVYDGKTPTTLWLESSAGYMRPEIYKVTYRQDGQEPVTTYVEAKIDGWYFGNIFFGGLVGMLLIDPLTGAMWKIPPGATVVNVESHDGFDDGFDDGFNRQQEI
jgi:hypothetical protein